MAITLDSRIESLSQKVVGFQHQTSNTESSFIGKTVSVQTVEEAHKTIFTVYQNLQQEITKLKSDLNTQLTVANQDQFFSVIVKLTEVDTRTLEIMKTFNDHILTYSPTAKIEYGSPLISPQSAPVIATKNQKFSDLLSKSACIREIRGDGNCFLSALTTRFLEGLIKENAIGNFIDFVTTTTVGNEDLKTSLIITLLDLSENPAQLENVLQTNEKIFPFISYFRQITADELKIDHNKYAASFISDILDVFNGKVEGVPFSTLVDQYVLQMGTDFGHPMIAALCSRLNFPVTIIDPKIGAGEGFNVLGQTVSKGTFCRNEEHYFVLYTKKEAPTIAAPSLQPVKKPTEIVVKCQVPFGHNLFIRGSGSGLGWSEKEAKPLIQIDDQTWIFRSATPLADIEYKFLIDNSTWENRDNHKISQGKLDGVDPTFNLSAIPQPIWATRITVKCNVRPGDKLTIRGTCPGMNWNKGVDMTHLGDGIWIWETQSEFPKFEFKILYNDMKFESGMNHTIECGKKMELSSPQFEQ